MPAYNNGFGIARIDSEDLRVQLVRNAVLEALDAVAEVIYGEGTLGATDSELPELFRAIDRQAIAILERVCEERNR